MTVNVWGFGASREASIVRSAARTALAVLGLRGIEIDIAAVSAGEMARLNSRFRGRRGPTDVLSFAVTSGAPGGPSGEVYLCPDRVRPRSGRRYRMRLAELSAHGVLHVFGYHHSDPEAERMMFAVQRAILVKVSPG